MKKITQQFYTSLVLFLFCSANASAQNLIYSNDFNSGLANWTITDLNMNFGEWVLKDNGEADFGTYWNERERIATTGNAVVFDGDNLFSSGIGNPNLDYESALRSPPINLSAQQKVFLKFNQYFRNFDVDATVEVSANGGQTWTEVFNNSNVGANVETSRRDVQIVDITNQAAGEPKVLIRFVFRGKNYFWIVDDIELYDSYPYPKTNPRYFSDSLFQYGYPFEVDTSNWAYVPDEIVIQFKATATDEDKQKLRDTLGAIRIDSCVCNILELWRLGDNVYADGEQLSADGGNIGILERVNSAKSKSTVDGVDLNRYNYNQLQDLLPSVLPELTAVPTGIPNSTSSAVKIAVLDTGVDYDHPDLVNYIWKSNDTTFNDQDDDDSCYEDDPIGWNFIHDNNNPDDDHSHGTHVAGIIVNNILNNATFTCDFRIMPYKTHDEHGISNLFDASCATYLAAKQGADVINDSWGFYGDPSIILSNAFDSARINYNSLIVAAAGNDTINVSGLPQYPACFSGDNVVSVGSYDSLLIDIGFYEFPISAFSNFDNVCVDILAPGDSILSTIPVAFGSNDFKTGTSMATPAVSAAAAISFCSGVTDHQDVKQKLLDCATKESDLISQVLNGNLLNFDPSCIVPVEELEEAQFSGFSLYPNPVLEELNILSQEAYGDIELYITDVSGRQILSQRRRNVQQGEIINLSLSSLKQGIYFINIRQNHYFWTDKFIKI